MKKTTFARRTSLWLTLMAITCAPLAAQTGPGFGSLKCEQETDPVGIETPSPRFSWQLVSPERGCRQTAYRIVVAGTEKDAAAGRATMWDSGKVPGEQSLLIPYNGQPLEAAETYYWLLEYLIKQFSILCGIYILCTRSENLNPHLHK